MIGPDTRHKAQRPGVGGWITQVYAGGARLSPPYHRNSTGVYLRRSPPIGRSRRLPGCR